MTGTAARLATNVCTFQPVKELKAPGKLGKHVQPVCCVAAAKRVWSAAVTFGVIRSMLQL